jgi:hypothetical protein
MKRPFSQRSFCSSKIALERPTEAISKRSISSSVLMMVVSSWVPHPSRAR